MQLVANETGFYLLRKAKVKGHYRRLPNGKTIWIADHKDKRKDAKKDPKKFRHRIIHSDDESTTYVNHADETKTVKHAKHQELTQDDIHGKLNSAFHIDDNLALKVWASENGVEDLNEFLKKLVEDEKAKAKQLGKEPEFTKKTEAMKWLFKNQVKEVHKDLQETHGTMTTYAKAATNAKGGRGRLAEYFEHTKDNPNASDEDQAISKMASEHSESAIAAQEEEMAAIQAAKRAEPDDCPKIDSLDPSVKFFGHQAQTLAQLDLLKKAVIDVDMGGGKGLILPMDAMNLMGQGKVKKPLVVVPGATLEQNAQKILEYTGNSMNVFLISNSHLNEHHDGDMDKMLEAMAEAPPNTIFMASYDIFSYQDRREKSEEEDEAAEFEEFPRAKALGGAGFDYVACDESHNIKNMESNRFKAMQYLTHIPYKRVASGTFLANNPKDILGQMAFLHPHTAMKESEFEEKYGMSMGERGIKWDKDKLKTLREDLMNMGMISLRRSAWMHLLPERQEIPRRIQMEKEHSKIHEAILNETMDQIEDEMKKDKRLRKLMDDDDVFNADEDLPPNLLGPLNLLQSVTDHPDELAKMLEESMKTVKDAKKEAKSKDKELDPETEAMRQSIARMTPAVRAAVLKLKGTISPKALDVYKTAEAHLKDPKNGKFMVFVQRKASARHIMDNMPEHLKKHAMYFDASQMHKLKEFTGDSGGPKILVAVDASVKEGVNMQIANGQYRYDHHYVPGNQEQGYARIWRFGQDKPAKIYLGLVDGGIDVTKYARLTSKLHTNMMVTSDMDDDDTFEAYKMNLDNIRYARNYEQLDQYFGMNKKILDYQYGENKGLRKKFGDKPLARSTGKQIGGKNPRVFHGLGSYQADTNFKKIEGKFADDKTMASLHGHMRDAASKYADAGHLDGNYESEVFPQAIRLLNRHIARGGKDKKLDDLTIKQELLNNKPLEKNKDLLKHATEIVNNHLSGKAHTKKRTIEDGVKAMIKHPKFKAQAFQEAMKDKEVRANMAKKSTELVKLLRSKGFQSVETDANFMSLDDKAEKHIERFFKDWEGSENGARFVIATALQHMEHEHGWESLKNQERYQDLRVKGE